jgi:hypothetical protein
MNHDEIILQTLTEDQHNLLNTIRKEYKMGMLALNSLGSFTFTFYGGHMVTEENPAYKLVEAVAIELAKRNWGIVSGGGPGIMSAALEGAKTAGGKAIAFNINIEDEEVISHHRDVSLMFTQFSVRKYMLRQSDAFAFAPGGFGTLDELMELTTLINTGKYPRKPIYLLDSTFWSGNLSWFKEILLNERRVVDPNFMDMFTLVDSANEVISHLYQHTSKVDIV